MNNFGWKRGKLPSDIPKYIFMSQGILAIFEDTP